MTHLHLANDPAQHLGDSESSLLLQAKIETLENQVTKLTAQTRSLAADKEDLSGRAAKLSDLLQARDRALVNLTSQVSNLRCSGSADSSDSLQLTLTYCNPPLVLSSAQVSLTSLPFHLSNPLPCIYLS